MTLSKKMMNAYAIENNEQLFRCPVCAEAMKLVESSRLVCTVNHSFDLSKQGYVNLAPQAHTTKYDKSLFTARKTVIDGGFFRTMLEELTKVISSELRDAKPFTILDAGCGEGSHLNEILSQLTSDVVGVGIDLAKEGIVAAAKAHPGKIWSVADLASCPFQDGQFDVILNILSPANYAEFARLLKRGGLFIKVIPESHYLEELREVFYDEEKSRETNPVERMAAHFEEVKAERITYSFSLENGLLAPLIRMTPLTWGASEEKVAEAYDKNITSITVDFKVLIGRRL